MPKKPTTPRRPRKAATKGGVPAEGGRARRAARVTPPEPPPSESVDADPFATLREEMVGLFTDAVAELRRILHDAPLPQRERVARSLLPVAAALAAKGKMQGSDLSELRVELDQLLTSARGGP